MRTLKVLIALALLGGAAAGQASAAPGAEQELRIARLLAPQDASDEVPPTPSQRYPYLIPRSTADRPDERTGSLIHVVYLVPADAADDRLDELGVLEDSMLSQNAWFAEQSEGLRWRLDTFHFEWDDPSTRQATSVEAVDVTFIRSSRTADELNGAFEVADELAAHGLDEADKRYLSYVASDAGNICGDAIYTVPVPPDRPVDGQYAQVYLDSSPGCRARHFAPGPQTPSFSEAIAQHEILHNESLVWVTAPHHCWIPVVSTVGHVCTAPLALTGLDPERVDLMFPFVGRPLSDQVLDRDHDDYFSHSFPFRDLDESVYLQADD